MDFLKKLFPITFTNCIITNHLTKLGNSCYKYWFHVHDFYRSNQEVFCLFGKLQEPHHLWHNLISSIVSSPFWNCLSFKYKFAMWTTEWWNVIRSSNGIGKIQLLAFQPLCVRRWYWMFIKLGNPQYQSYFMSHPLRESLEFSLLLYTHAFSFF